MKYKSEALDRYSLGNNHFFIRRTANLYLINSVVAMLFLYASSLIDTLLVGIFLGEDGLAAMSLISPVFLIYYTVGATIGIGASVCSSRALGEEDPDEYRKLFTASSILLAALAIVMTLVSYCFSDTIIKLLCGSVTGVQAEMAKEYFLYYVPGGAATLMAYIPLYFLRVEGKPKLASNFFLLSGAINIVLSWLFMSPVFSMGIAGASLATTFSFFTVVVAGSIVLLKGPTELRFVRNSFSKKRLRTIVEAGIPLGLSNLMESGRILLLNMLIIGLGAPGMLSCYTVVRNVSDILNAVIVGMSAALNPLVGVLYGERSYKDTRFVLKRTMKIGVIVMAVLTVLVCIFAAPICTLFGVTDLAIISEIRWAIPLANIGLVLCFANQLYISYLSIIQREGLATLLASLRLLIMVAAFAIPLAYIVGVHGIWLSLSLAEISSFALFCIFRRRIRGRRPTIDRYLLDTSLEGDDFISFAVKNDISEIVKASEKITIFCNDNGIDTRTSGRIGHALEEILTFLLTHCLGENKENVVAVRIYSALDDIIVRFRYVGNVYNPIDYYQNNAENSELYAELLGLRMIVKSAKNVDYQLMLGINNIIITF